MEEGYVIGRTSRVFYAKFPDGSKAFLRYSVEKGVLRLIETYTPPQHRGKGVAGRLTEEALRLAEEKGLKVEPICSYAIYYFLKHPEKRHLLVDELRDADLEELFKQRLEEERKKK